MQLTKARVPSMVSGITRRNQAWPVIRYRCRLNGPKRNEPAGRQAQLAAQDVLNAFYKHNVVGTGLIDIRSAGDSYLMEMSFVLARMQTPTSNMSFFNMVYTCMVKRGGVIESYRRCGNQYRFSIHLGEGSKTAQ